MKSQKTITLAELSKGSSGIILKLESGSNPELTRRMMEIGLLEGSRVELVHEAPFGKDPIAVRVRGALIALRRSEARQVTIAVEESAK